MSDGKATLLVCDEVLYSLTGKLHLQGIYTGDISISGKEMTINQMVFFFNIDLPRTYAQESEFRLKVMLPGTDPHEITVPMVVAPGPNSAERERVVFKQPYLLQRIVLRPGQIRTSVLVAGQEINAGGAWVVAA